MDMIIYTYLDSIYEIKTSDMGNDGIYPKINLFKHKAPIDKDDLLKELNFIFKISDDTSKKIIDIWSLNHKKDIDLDFYWKSIEDFI
jgi:hypothetical protein